jgi:hypothetical protein
MRVDNTKNFTELYGEVKQNQADQGYKAGKHLRFDDQNKLKGLYFHTGVSRPRIFDWSGKYAARRAEKQADAGQHVWQSIANQHGEDVANGIFKNVLRYEGGDHRASITLGDLDRIKRALPLQLEHSELEKVKQEAIQLAADADTTVQDLDQFYSENIELLSSKRFEDTLTAKVRGDEFHTIRAFAYLDRVINSESDYSIHDFDMFLNELGIDRNQVPKEEQTRLAQITDRGRLREETKQWMADKLYEKCFKTGGDYQLNLESGRDREKFSRKYQSLPEKSDQKLQMLREQYRTIISGDVKEIAKATARAIADIQGLSRDDVDSAVQATDPSRRKALLRAQECSVKNKKRVRDYLPGTKDFDRVLSTAGWYPQLLQHTEKRYISERLRGLAELKAQSGVEVDRKWAEKQLQAMLKELDGADSTRNSALPQLQREAEIAASELLNAFLDTRSMSLPDLNAKLLDFQEKSARLSHARQPNFGPEDVQDDQKLLLLRAAGRLRNLPHLDPLANLSTLLRTACLAMADPRTDQRNFFDNSRSSKIEPHVTEYINILQFAVDQVQFRKGKPDLGAEFEEQRSLAEQAAQNRNSKFDIPGVSPRDVRQTVDTIVTRGLEAVERRDLQEEREESVSVFEPPDENEN